MCNVSNTTDNQTKKISVIVPVYNVAIYLKKCIDSIIHQTYSNLQIILVDDGSTDMSGNICDEYAEIDSRIEVIHKINGGLSDARNAGLAKAEGEYIGFIDSDDFISPDMYEKMLLLCEKNCADLAICRLQIVDENGNRITTKGTKNVKIMSSDETMYYYIIENPQYLINPSVCTKLFKKEIINNIQFPYGILCEDIVYTTKAINQSKIVAYIDEALYFYLSRESSIMNNSTVIKRRIENEKEQYKIRIDYLQQESYDKFAEICRAKLYIRLIQRYYEYSKTNDSEFEDFNQKICKSINSLRRDFMKHNFIIPMQLKERLGYYVSLISIKLYVKLRSVM